MATTRRGSGRGRRALTAVALLLGVSGIAVPPAGAAPEPVSAPVTGSLTTNASVFDLEGAIFQGTFDPATGDLVGKFVFPGVTVSVTQPVEATIGLQVQQPADGTGSVDLVTNEATFTADLVLALLTLDALGSGPLNVAPCRYSMPVEMTGTYDPVTGILSLTDPAFSTSVINDPNRCFWDGLGASVATSIDPEILSDGNALAASFDVGETSAEPPPPPPPPAEPAPEEPPAAAPTGAAPNFTG